MNWDAIGAIAESIGALGVAVSLGYLAMEIGQSGSGAEQDRIALSLVTIALAGIGVAILSIAGLCLAFRPCGGAFLSKLARPSSI